MVQQPGPAGGRGRDRWFERGQRVRFGAREGTVESSFTSGIHYVFVERERRIFAVPGNMLTKVNALATARNGQAT